MGISEKKAFNYGSKIQALAQNDAFNAAYFPVFLLWFFNRAIALKLSNGCGTRFIWRKDISVLHIEYID